MSERVRIDREGHAPTAPMRSFGAKPAPRLDAQDTAAPGICRICRSEGTPDEPLFYPCRCSGSIQHVHQDCLMEWLSHSQKKYCELCKTPFRFTKFYNPNMPQSLPITVFFRQVSRYLIENSLGWLRAFIAVSFWVSGLPWFMRRGWSSIFWLSQESWAGPGGHPGSPTSGGFESSTIHLSSTMLGLDMCPASPLFAPTTTPAADVETMLGWWGSQTISGFLLRCLCRLTGISVPSSVSTLHVLDPSMPRPIESMPVDSKTLLGNVRLLKTLTRSASLNQGIISVMEGQIITVVVIVSFILVILVRDYVVQQQPEINGRGGFAVENEQQFPARAPGGFPAPDPDDARGGPPARVPPARVPDPAPQEDLHEHGGSTDESDDESEDEPVDVRGAQAPRLRTARERGLEQDRQRPAAITDEEARRVESEAIREPSSSTADARSHGVRGTTPVNQGSSDDGSTDIIYTPDHSQTSGTDIDAFKENLEATGSLRQPFAEPEAGPSRPRAVSDGPRVQTNVNPLANNAWSFGGPSIPSTNANEPLGPQNEDLPSNAARSEQSLNHEHQDRSADGTLAGNDHHHPTTANSEAQQTANGEAPRAPGGSGNASASEPQNADGSNKAVSDRITDFMWGDVETPSEATPAEIVDDGIDRDAWVDVPMEEGDPVEEVIHNIGQQGVDIDGAEDLDEGAEPALDPEAIDDMEDFEGIMELLGMRGPITNLFQNVIFCAVLVQTALFACVFVPFNVGRITFWIVAKPVRLARILFELSKVIQDLCFVVVGFTMWVACNLIDMITSPFGGSLAAQVVAARKGSWGFFAGAGSRVGGFIELLALDLAVPGSGMRYWSAASHEALMSIQGHVASFFFSIGDAYNFIFRSTDQLQVVTSGIKSMWSSITGLSSSISSSSSWVVELSPEHNSTVSVEHAYWPAADITWAVLAGYVTVFALATLYLRTGIRFARGTSLEEWETGIVDSLYQASGILKVITIISIEMLVFPLYCGLLLDCALLPLFSGASMKSRLLFTYSSPWTSIFVHWFVGTGYMFHFALFVSMCRKIMRPGVLYFIRDPDDPEFHPVRDVLERNLMTQLRKILFSAFVYGALVIVCLGGVVWGLAYAVPNVLPIHYSSNEPVLEFPVDLLFYNFFMPLAFKIFKPSDGLHAMYRWCFRKSARILRLTFFLFGERRIDEEGTLHLAEDSPFQDYPMHRRAFLGLNADQSKVVPKSWKDIVDGVNTSQRKSLSQEIKRLSSKKQHLVKTGQLVEDGRFVRAPASDRVKIPKGQKVFFEVTERGRRPDGKLFEGIHATNQFQMVYVPPHLLTRVFLFILLIWSFAAVTGVGLTIIPLVLGRKIFKMAIPDHVRTNDIYAFCIGIHILGFAAYSIVHAPKLWADFRPLLSGKASDEGESKSLNAVSWCLRGLQLCYAYSFILVVCPLILSTLVELYISLPAHTLLNPPTAVNMAYSTKTGGSPSQHRVRIIEAWTLGLLYMRLAANLVSSFLPDTRFAAAMRLVFHNGWLQPNVKVLTRAFIIPGLLVATLAIFGPGTCVQFLEARGFFTNTGQNAHEIAAEKVIRFRQSYPVLAFMSILAKYCMVMKGSFDTLKAQVRDDAYLMGERLQNYDGSPPDTNSGRGKAPRPPGGVPA